MIKGAGYQFFEFGAYMAPIAFQLTITTVGALRRRWVVAGIAVSCAVTVHAGVLLRKDAPDRAFGEAALAHFAATPDRLVVACFAEFDGVFDLVYEDRELRKLLRRLVGAKQLALEASRSGVDRADLMALWFDPRVAGVTTVVTEAALAQLRGYGGVFAELVDEALPKALATEPVRSVGPGGGSMRGWRFVAR